MEFFYSSDAGRIDFIVLMACCAVGLIFRQSRTMACAAVLAFLTTRTIMAVMPEKQQAFPFFLAGLMMFSGTMAVARSKPEQVFAVMYIPIMGLNAAQGYGLIERETMTAWWVVILVAQMLIILGGAAHGGVVAMGKRDAVAGAVRGVASLIARRFGRP